MSKFKIIVDNFLNSGINVLPVNRDKIPYDFKSNTYLIWQKYQTEFVINNGLFDDTFGMCAVCGAISGNLVGIDIDTKNDAHGNLWEVFHEKLIEFLPNVAEYIYIETSPSGGYHLFFRTEGKSGIGKEIAARNEFGKAVIELMGEGATLTCFPTPNYKTIQGKFSNLPVLSSAQTDILLSLCRSFNEYIELKDTKDYPRKPYLNDDGSKSPFQEFNERGNAIEILEKHGWNVLKKRGDTNYLRFPNSNSKTHHATFNKIPNYLYCFSPNSVFEDYKAYSQSAIYCKLECGDDWKLCRKKLLEMGFGEASPEREYKPVINRATLPANVLTEPPDITQNLPEFPFDAFPKLIQEIVNTVSDVKDYQKDFLAIAILNAVSASLGLTHKLILKNGWVSYGSLYTAIVGDPAVGKSPVLKWAFAPIMKYQAELEKQNDRAKSEYERNKALTKKERSMLGIQELIEPQPLDAFISDTTLESVMKTHYYNRKGFLLFSEELLSWVKKFNAYRQGGGGDEKVWLSIFDNSFAKVGRVDKRLFIPKTYITICGGIQTDVLKELARGSLADDGFLYRFLFCFTKIKEKDATWDELCENPLPISIEQNYQKMIYHLLQIKYEEDNEKVLTMTPEANKVWGKWFDNNKVLVKKYRTDGNKPMISISTKLSIYCSRFALLFQIINYICGEDDCQHVQKEAVESAIKLIEYFRVTSQMALIAIDESFTKEKEDRQSSNMNSSKVNWVEVFENDVQLPYTKIAERVVVKYGKSKRTAERWIKAELNKLENGEYTYV